MKKAKGCESCGYPAAEAKAAGDWRLGTPYCMECTDEKGRLKPYGEMQKGFARWIASRAKTRKGALMLASWLMSYQPAWRSRR